jgi:outer membrane immunogenic protein
MLIPNFTVNISLGSHMNQFFFRLVFAAAALVPASSVLAADLDIPPPVENLRPATYDWSGPYAGAFVGGAGEFGTTNTTCVLCGIYDRELHGWQWNGGFNAGWNYQIDDFVMGVEGDWAFGGNIAQNHEPTEMLDLAFNNVASIRARLGMAFDDTLVYLTGGLAAVDAEFSSNDYPTGTGGHVSDGLWVKGWVIGGGIEHAFSDRLSGRLEYTYMQLADADYTFDDGLGNVTPFTQTFDGVHQVRVGLDYKFGW